jgi:hypothetical protein
VRAPGALPQGGEKAGRGECAQRKRWPGDWRPLCVARNRAPSAQKNALKPWPPQQGGRPHGGAEFVAQRAALLDFCAEPSAPPRAKVTCAEPRTHLRKALPTPLPGTPGHGARYDEAAERTGRRKLLLFCDPPAGGRQMGGTEQRPLPDFAPQRKGGGAAG